MKIKSPKKKFFFALYNKKVWFRVVIIESFKTHLPMQYFTPDEIRPSERTLNIIRQIAYTYRVMKSNGKPMAFCLN